MKELKDLFLSELSDVYDSERRIVKALPRMIRATTCLPLKSALRAHLMESKGHVTTLAEVFRTVDEKVRGRTCLATIGLLEEAAEVAIAYKGSPALNAAMVSACQKIEHYEIASYGCLHEWAAVLGNKRAATLLHGILTEEKAADGRLIELARTHCNKDALAGTVTTGVSGNGTLPKARSLRSAIRAPRVAKMRVPTPAPALRVSRRAGRKASPMD